MCVDIQEQGVDERGRGYVVADRIRFTQDSQSYYCVKLSLHRYIYGNETGHEIRDGYDIHHIDGDKENNSIDNLEEIKNTDHAKRHADEGRVFLGIRKCLCCGREFNAYRYHFSHKEQEHVCCSKRCGKRFWHMKHPGYYKTQYRRNLRKKFDKKYRINQKIKNIAIPLMLTYSPSPVI